MDCYERADCDEDDEDINMQYQSPHHRGTPPGRSDVHRVRDSRSVRRQRLFAGVLAACVAVAAIIFLVFGQPMSGLIGLLLGRDVAPASGRIAFYSDRDGDMGGIYVMNADGSGMEQLPESSLVSDPVWSPDGQRIAFTSDRDGDNGNVYVMNADGSGVEQLTDNEFGDWVPAWSPDGGRIAYVSRRDLDWEVYVMNADGTGVLQLTDNEYYDGATAWSPDGGRIAFTSDRDGDKEIYVMNAAGGLWCS